MRFNFTQTTARSILRGHGHSVNEIPQRSSVNNYLEVRCTHIYLKNKPDILLSVICT